jgi:hypothetical protein
MPAADEMVEAHLRKSWALLAPPMAQFGDGIQAAPAAVGHFPPGENHDEEQFLPACLPVLPAGEMEEGRRRNSSVLSVNPIALLRDGIHGVVLYGPFLRWNPESGTAQVQMRGKYLLRHKARWTMHMSSLNPFILAVPAKIWLKLAAPDHISICPANPVWWKIQQQWFKSATKKVPLQF